MGISVRRAVRPSTIRIPREGPLREHARVEDPNRAALAARAVEVKDLGVFGVVEKYEADNGASGCFRSASQLPNRTHASRVATQSDGQLEAVRRLCEQAANLAR